MSGGRGVVVRGGCKLTPPHSLTACIVYHLACLLLHGVCRVTQGELQVCGAGYTHAHTIPLRAFSITLALLPPEPPLPQLLRAVVPRPPPRGHRSSAFSVLLPIPEGGGSGGGDFLGGRINFQPRSSGRPHIPRACDWAWSHGPPWILATDPKKAGAAAASASLRKSGLPVGARRCWRAWGCQAPCAKCRPKAFVGAAPAPHVFHPVVPEPTNLRFLQEESRDPKAGVRGGDLAPQSGSRTLGLNAETSEFRAPSRGRAGRGAWSQGPGSLGSEGPLGQQGGYDQPW